MNKPLRIFLGLCVSGFCLWFVFKGFDFNAVRQNLREATFIWLLPAACLYVINMTLRSLRWRILISPLKKIPIRVVMPSLIVGFMMNNILPARGGELVRAVTLSKKADLPVSSIFGSVVAERLTDMMGFLMVIGIASRLLPWDKLPVKGILLIVILGAIASAVFVVLAKKSQGWEKDTSTLKGKLLARFSELTAGFLALQSFSKVAAVVALSASVWLIEVIMPFFISRALHFDLSFLESAGLLTGLSVGVMIPAAPGFVGTYEFFGKTVLEMMGRPASIGLGFVLVLHFFHTAMTVIMGLPSLLILELKETPKP